MNNKRPANNDRLVSIIINNYNYGRFLRDAIDSVLQQTYTFIEVIVVDDGSTDNSREIIHRYRDQIIPIFKKNGGQASAFNTGFAQSRGEVVIFLDSDDMLLPGVVARVVEVFDAHSNLAKVMYRMEVIDTMGTRTNLIQPPAHQPMRSGDLRRHVLTFPFDMTWMATSGNAFAARVLQQIFPIPEQVYGRVGADWYISLLTPLFGPVIFLNDIGALYRIHGSNNYKLSTSTINLEIVRQAIRYSSYTIPYIKKFADQLSLDGSPKKAEDLLSVSLLSKRMISLKLEPEQHPIKEDTMWRIFWLGVKATFRRFDVSWPMKILYLLWFVAMLFSPRRLARWLAELFAFPSRRRKLNRLIAMLHLREKAISRARAT